MNEAKFAVGTGLDVGVESGWIIYSITFHYLSITVNWYMGNRMVSILVSVPHKLNYMGGTFTSTRDNTRGFDYSTGNNLHYKSEYTTAEICRLTSWLDLSFTKI